MRSSLTALICAVALLAAPAAMAAPTCQTQAGDAARCGAPGAMPVGWTAPGVRPDSPADPVRIVSLVALLGALFGLIALLPDFDGRNSRDWGEQEGDDEPAE